MGIKAGIVSTLKKVCHAAHIDGPLRSLWRKTSRYQLRICKQELAWKRQAELAEEQRQRAEEERRRAEEERRRAEEERLAEERRAQAQRELEAQKHREQILRMAQGVKAALGDEDATVHIYQYFYLDTKGEQCYNGGAERYIRDLAALLAREHRRVTLVQMGDAESGDVWTREQDGMTIVGVPCTYFEYPEVVEQLPAAPLNLYSGYLKFGRLHHPNILISHGVTWDGVWENADVQALGDCLNDVDTLVSVDTNTLSWLRSTFAKRLTEQATQMRYIPNYADLTVFHPAEQPTAHQGVRIVFPRRASVERGFWLIAEILPRILKEFQDVTFDFVGFVHLPEFEQRIDALVDGYGGRVRRIMVRANEMPGVYQNADISVVPTLCTEGTSLSLIEAMACGSAVVCTNVGGLPDLVIDGYNGLMVNPDAKELYAALRRLITDAELRKELSRNALDVARQFSKTLWDKRWTELLRQKLAAPPPRTAKRHTRVLTIDCSLYQGDAYHGYLNALYWAKQNGWLVLAPESYIARPLQYEDWMFEFHNMERVTEEERRAVPQLMFPDSLIEQNEQDGRSYTESNLDLFRYRNPMLEQALESQLVDYFATNPDTVIDSFMVYGESYRSLREVAARHGATVVCYEFSSVRTYKGFSQTLLFGCTDPRTFYCSDEPQKRYAAFCAESSDVPLLSRRELIALLYQPDIYPIIPLLEASPRHEIGVCLGGGLSLPIFSKSEYVDDDILREVTARYPINGLPRRLHPAAPMSALERSRIALDPLPFLLSCRRIAAAASNTSFEAMLWNRAAYSRGMNLPFSFMCTQNVESDDRVEERFLNWFLFGYCMPGHKRLFCEDYWRWRDTHPSETEIYLRHQGLVLGELGIDESLLALPEPQRFAAIMEKRGYSRAASALVWQDWENRASLRPAYEHLQSYVHIVDAQGQVYAKYKSLNLQTDEGIVSRFALESDPRRVKADFCPLQEGIGFVRILRASAGGKELPLAPEDRAFRCMQPYAVVALADSCLCGDGMLEIVWQVREIDMENLPRLRYAE